LRRERRRRDREQRPRQRRDRRRADARARHGAGKVDVVVPRAGVVPPERRGAVRGDVVHGLDVERLLDLGVGRREQVGEDGGGDGERGGQVCGATRLARRYGWGGRRRACHGVHDVDRRWTGRGVWAERGDGFCWRSRRVRLNFGESQ
jgi:hypothetical protein